MAKQIGELTNSALQAQESAVSKNGDLYFVECLQSKKIKDCSIEEIKQPLRMAMLLVGIREQNLPKDEEKFILIRHIIENFGGNHIDEIYLAFKKALAGELDIDEKEVNAYENFSCLYFSRVMNSYRRWAIQEYRQHEKTIVPETRQLTYENQIHWGALIQHEYEHFLSFGEEKANLWPAEFYSQLEKDGFIEKDYFRKVMPMIRQKLIGELLREKAKIQNASLSGVLKGRKEAAENIRQTNMLQVDNKIKAYQDGAADREIELAAKQFCVVKLFKAAKEKFREHIYKPESI